jgi:DNA glycosylase AlkZ-like
MSTGRPLSQRALNRALLARQLLLRRAELDVPAALQRMAGLQAQYAPAMYIGLWSRVDGLRRAAVTEALERRSAVQGTLLRSTIHLVSAADYWPFAHAMRQGRREWYLRITRGDPSEADLRRAAAKLRAALDDGPLRQTEIDKIIGSRLRTAVGLWLEMVRIPPSGTWERRRADLYQLAETWLGPPRGSPEEGLELLVRRYLAGFGPATRADIARWAGLPVAPVAAAVKRLPLRHLRGDDGADLLDLPAEELPDDALPDEETPAPVRFLPVWDATLLVHARRTGVLPEEHRPRIFSSRNPHSFNTFLVDGVVAGTWRHDGDRIVLDEFGPLPGSVRRDLAEEAERLRELHRP